MQRSVRVHAMDFAPPSSRSRRGGSLGPARGRAWRGSPLGAWLGARVGRLLLTLLLACAASVAQAETVGVGEAAIGLDHLRLDEVVMKGSHNSYHRWPFLALHPKHRYQHDSLYAQLEHQGVRAMELDVHLSERGTFEVYHIALIDDETHCRELADCLEQVRAWSDGRRDHEPLFIWIELKDYAGGETIESARDLDWLIRGKLGDRLLTPDDVRGGLPSLRMALQSRGWPTVAESRGRIVFMLMGADEQIADYTSQFQHLRGRVMFADAATDHLDDAWAAVAKAGDVDSPLIAHARANRLIVSTGVCMAQLSDSACAANRAQALASGANILLDDYVRPTPERSYYLDLGLRNLSVAAHVPVTSEPVDAAHPGVPAAGGAPPYQAR